MQTVSRGFRIHYEISGHGPPVLLVPGVFMSAARWVQTGYVDDLTKDYRVVAVDPLGHGMSDKPSDPSAYSDPEVVKDLAAVLDAEGIDRLHYWGYSRGAHHGYLFALLYPERLLSLTLGGYSTSRPGEWHQVMPLLAASLRAGDWDTVLGALGVSDEATRAILRQNDAAAMAAVLMAEAVSETPKPERIAAPTLVYIGSKEPDVEVARRDAEAMGGRFLVLEGRGHAGAFQSSSVVLPEFRAHVASRQS